MSDADRDRLREFYGHDISDKDLEYFGARLARQLNALERLRAWQPELDLTEPATVPNISRDRGS